MNENIDQIKSQSLKFLLNQYKRLSTQYLKWKIENFPFQSNKRLIEGTGLSPDEMALPEMSRSLMIERDNELEELRHRNSLFEYEFPDEENLPIECKEIEATLKTISYNLKSKNTNNIEYLFNRSIAYLDHFEIEVLVDPDLINNAAGISRIKNVNLVYTSPPTNIIIPELIIPTRSYLISLIKKQPNLIFSIPPRQFEEIIAEIFRSRGFEIELTQSTHDGGIDIIAIHETLNIPLKFLIECKRYAPTNKVDISIVQRLFGVKAAQSANKAILATTSSFTKSAKEFASEHLWDLDLKAYDDIISWIRGYRYPGEPFQP